MDDLRIVSKIAQAGLKAQATRLRVVAENMANADSVANTPGGEPYRRKLVVFQNELDRALDTRTVRADKVIEDRSQFQRQFDPNHPAADENGYVLMPNVNPLVEAMDMREAQRSYNANLNAIEVSRDMMRKTLALLK